MAAETRNNCISETMKDNIDFPKTNLGFLTTESSKKVSASDCNSSQQPEVAIWPRKPEILIFLELWQIASKCQRQIQHFDHDKLDKSVAKRLRQRPIIGNDNVVAKTKILISLEYTNGVSDTPSSKKKLSRAIATTIDNRKCFSVLVWLLKCWVCLYDSEIII